jgi:hypothetical protein
MRGSVVKVVWQCWTRCTDDDDDGVQPALLNRDGDEADETIKKAMANWEVAIDLDEDIN